MPWLREGLVLAGETWASLASSKTFCMDSATPEFSGPTTPRTVLSATSLVAFCWPEDGWAWSSRDSSLKVTPLTYSFLLAVLTARSAEFLMPRPRADSSPVSGASRPMVTVTLPLSPFPAPPLSSREPQAVRVSAPAVTAVVSMSNERFRTKGPFPGAAPSDEVVP